MTGLRDPPIASDGTMDLRRAELRSEQHRIVLDKRSDANLLMIAGAEIYEPQHNDKADVRPSHLVGVEGVPARGGVE